MEAYHLDFPSSLKSYKQLERLNLLNQTKSIFNFTFTFSNLAEIFSQLPQVSH